MTFIESGVVAGVWPAREANQDSAAARRAGAGLTLVLNDARRGVTATEAE